MPGTGNGETKPEILEMKRTLKKASPELAQRWGAMQAQLHNRALMDVVDAQFGGKDIPDFGDDNLNHFAAWLVKNQIEDKKFYLALFTADLVKRRGFPQEM